MRAKIYLFFEQGVSACAKEMLKQAAGFSAAKVFVDLAGYYSVGF
jgi:hypothetical protein